MFFRNQQIVLQHPEMGNAIQGIPHVRANIDDPHTLPMQAYGNFYIKIHALS
jgi:hypothetical protein